MSYQVDIQANPPVELIEPRAMRGTSSSALRAGVVVRVGVAEKPGLFARLWRKSGAHVPSSRDSCYIVAVLMLLDRGLALDGLVTSINTSTVMFRQAATFIFDRTGAEVSVRFGDHDRRGRIVAVSPEGYLVELNEILTSIQLDDLLNDYGQARQ